MTKISVSMLASDYSKFGEEALRMQRAGVDFLHMDVMDGCFVPNISFGAGVIKAVHKVCDAPLDVHLMVNDPIRYAQDFVEAGASILHIDNPVGYHTLESNQLYIHKVEESLHTLFAYREELEGYSPLLDGVEMLRRKHLLGVARQLYSPLATLIRRNLTGKNPSLLLFKVFKVGTYLQIMK